MPKNRETKNFHIQAAGRTRPKEVPPGVKGRRGAGEIRFTINSRGQSRCHPGWLRQALGLWTVGLVGRVSIQWLLIKGPNCSPGTVGSPFIRSPGPDSFGWTRECLLQRRGLCSTSTLTSREACGSDCAHDKEPLRPSSPGPTSMTSCSSNCFLRNPISKSSPTGIRVSTY